MSTIDHPQFEVEFLDEELETYDLELEHEDHQFYLSNGILTSNSHAVAYAIDSWWTAYLLTYYEEEWLSAYIESMIVSPLKKAKAIGELKRLGYTISNIDINYADMNWTVLPGKRFMPSMISCKGIGETAVQEILERRPFKSIEDLLFNEDGTWRPNKFNRRSLETLIRIRALDSLGCVGEGKLFSSYRHMYEVLIENSDKIKKTNKKDPFIGKKNMYELARTLGPIEEWTRKELVENEIDAFGNLDVLALVGPEILEKLEQHGIKSIDDLEEGDTEICWFCVKSQIMKKTKNGKAYVRMTIVGPSTKEINMNIWGARELLHIEEYTICLAEVKRDNYGCSTLSFKVKKLG